MPNPTSRGYLEDDFRIFHNLDKRALSFDYHYHEFHKITILLQGSVSYYIEGKNYTLNPYDVVLIPKGAIHRPVIDPKLPYERILIYCSPDYLERHSLPGASLLSCFERAKETPVLRMLQSEKSPLYRTLLDLESACKDEEFAYMLYRRAQFMRFIIELNRAMQNKTVTFPQTEPENARTAEIRRYLDEHLTEDLSVDRVAQAFFLSRYHLMRLFKADTGFTINEYITVQRLQLVQQAMMQGKSATEAALFAGFGTYSSYYRAAKRFSALRTPDE